MKTKEMVYVAMFAAIMAVLGAIPAIPLTFTPVPITLQTLGVMLAGGILGARLGMFSQVTFLLLIAVGAPLLSGGRGGLSVFFGPSGGFLLGWIAGAFVIGFIIERFKEVSYVKTFFANIVGGIFVVYLFGIPFQAFMMKLSIFTVMKTSLVYLPGDLIKVVLATFIITKLRNSALPIYDSLKKSA